MLTRGVKYVFKTGENVLSFEPDSSKAKVLYNAKVLDCSVTRDKHARRKPAYLIHFQGWNNSWDRVVPESFLLKNTDENRCLMHKLSTISTRVKRNSVRIRKIDSALRKHFQRRNRRNGAADRGGDSDSDSETDTEEDGGGSKVSSKANSPGGEDEERGDVSSSGEEEDEMDSEHEGNKSSIVSSSDEEEKDETGEATRVKLELSEIIKQKLIQDYDLINKQRQLLIVPAAHNVITILENYVRAFALSQVYDSVEKQRSHRLRSQQHHSPEKSIELCKEMVDGLRVIFDFTLPLILLYNTERDQYQHLMDNYSPTHTMHQLVSINESTADSTCDSSSDEVSFRTPPPTGLPVLRRQTSPEAHLERRVTRLSSSSAAASDPTPPVISSCSSKQPHQAESMGGAEKKRRSSLNTHQVAPNLSRHGQQVGAEDRSVEQGGGGKTAEVRSASRKRKSVAEGGKSASHDVTGSPALQRKSRLESLSSIASSSLTVSGLLHDAEQELLKEKVVRDVASWKLIPSQVYGESGEYQIQPSVVYGAHHLLRLFVELPEILSRMHLQTERRRHLVKHLEMFIEYLSNHGDELLPVTSSYIKTEELPALAKIKKSH